MDLLGARAQMSTKPASTTEDKTKNAAAGDAAAGAGDNKAGAGGDDKAAAAEAAAAAAAATAAAEADNKLLADLKVKGINLNSLEDLKRLNQPPVETEDEKQAKIAARQEKIKAQFIKDGNTEDDYKRIQEILDQDDETLAKSDVIAELVAEGFTAAEAEGLYLDRYFIAGDGDRLFSEAQQAYGKKKIAKRAASAKAKAVAKLKNAETIVSGEEYRDKLHSTLAGNVEKALTEIGSKFSFQLIDSLKQPQEFSFDLKEPDVKEVKDFISNPENLRETIFNEDKTINIKRIVQLLTTEKAMQKMLTAALQDGESLAGGKVQAVFPSSPFFRGRRVSGTQVVVKAGDDKSKRGKAGQALFGSTRR